jgi:hypothetical protein
MSIRWLRPTVWAVHRFLKHPGYAGAYLYGRRHWRRVQAGGEPVPENRLIGQFVEQWGHHEAYITKEQYLEHQRILALNAKTSKQAHLGPGPALLEGRCFCRRHGAMMVHYHRCVRTKGWSFRCLGDYMVGGRQCASVPGIAIEELVVAEVLKSIAVPVVEEAHRLWRASQREWGQRHRGLQLELDRKLASMEQVKRRLLEQEEGSHPRVRAMLEDEYERVAVEIERFRQRVAHEEVAPDPFTEERWEELKHLCSDVRGIWLAPTTVDQDRKQLIRILVQRVVIESVEPERITLSVEWADGRPATRLEVFRTPYYHRRIWEWHLERISLEQIVERLGAMGARTHQERAWSLATVQKTLAIMVERARASGNVGEREIPPVRQQPHQVMLELHATGLRAEEIADRLNAMGLLTRFRAPWTAASVRRVLREKDERAS